MDTEVVTTLKRAGIDVTLQTRFPIVGIRLLDDDSAAPIGEGVGVISGDAVVTVRLKRAADLYSGAAVPPDFADGPTDEYIPFFAMIERTAADYCSIVGIEQDREFERVYRRLRKDPDATGGSALLSYIQAAARLYLSLRPTSRAELEAVLGRLMKSARTFAIGHTSTNYFDYALKEFLGGGASRGRERPGALGRILEPGRSILGL